MARRHKKMTRAQKRALNRKLFRAKRKGRVSSKRRGTRRAKSSHKRGRKATRRVRSAKRYSKKAYTRFGRRKSKRHHASSLKHRPSLAALMAMNHALGINPRRGKKRRPSKCWGVLRRTRRKLYSRR